MKKRILIVDDNSELRTLIRMTLDDEGYELLEAADGQQALSRAAEFEPDIVILDVMMPGGLDGFEVCTRIRQTVAGATAHVIMLTAKTQLEDMNAGVAAGANDYLTKPFSPLNLIEIVESAAA